MRPCGAANCETLGACSGPQTPARGLQVPVSRGKAQGREGAKKDGFFFVKLLTVNS